jgi:hypothetical protein
MRVKSTNNPTGSGDETVDGGRRSFFAFAAASPLVLLGLMSRPGPALAQAAAPACFDVEKLPMSQKSIRKSLGFQMHFTDPNKKCGTCNFYTPGSGDCGKCQIFDNGPTTVNSVCSSWAKKA